MDLTYEQEIVAKIRNMSPNIDEYFANQMYKKFVGDEAGAEEVTDRYLLNVALELLFVEVKDMGIEADLNVDDFLESPVELSTLFAIREKFDKDHLYETLKNLSDKTFSSFQDAYESIQLPEDLYMELVPWFARLFPEDPQWRVLDMSITRWYSTEAFGDHLSGIMKQLLENTDRNKAVVTDNNIASISKFLNLMKIRRDRITSYIHDIYKQYEDLDQEVLAKYIKNYDIQKLNNDQLPLFAAYNDIKPKEEPPFLKQHHLDVNHHVEYWVSKWERHQKYQTPMPKYTKEIAVMLVVSLVLDDLTPGQMKNRIKPLKEIVDRDCYEFTKELTNFNYKLGVKK